MKLRGSLAELQRQLGAAGLAALAAVGVTACIHGFNVLPMQERRDRLLQQLERRARNLPAHDLSPLGSASPAQKLAAFYRFFEREESVTDWLAKLHGVATSLGIELRSADYRLNATSGRLDRYQISLPVRGTSAQVRAFADNALSDVPVLSLDQISFRRRRTSETLVEAEMSVSLYLLRK